VADHYDVLGVSREATPEEIKKAYRRMAREYHPDVNSGPDAEEKFKLVTHAYDVLSDPDQRRRYDLGDSGGAAGGGDFSGGFGDIFNAFFGQGAGRQAGPRSRKERGQDALMRIQVELPDVIFGAHRDIEVDTAILCDRCFGSCCEPGTGPVTCDICGGSGQVRRTVRSLLGNVVTASPCNVCRGYGTVIPTPCTQCAGNGRVRARRTIAVDIPAGVETGMRIQLSGEGEAGQAGGPNADLFLEISVLHHEVFSRDGDDLLATLSIQMTDAIFGTTASLDSLDGPVELPIKAGAQSGDVVTVRERGIGRLRSAGRGELRVALQVVTPTKIDGKQRELLEEFASRGKPKAPEFSHFQQGLFAKLRDRFQNWS
jgi:molecular chaperone DnaJ